MARINRSTLTKLELIRYANKSFLEKGYSNTSINSIGKELNISPGNITFHFPAKEHLLAALVELLCDFQWKLMEKEANEGLSSIMAVCLEFATIAAICEEDEVAKDFFLSAYTSPLCLAIIRKNDTERAKSVFKEYCVGWTQEQFEAAEILTAGMEYSSLVTEDVTISLEARIAGAVNGILTIFQVPEEIRKVKIEKVLSMDYIKLGRKVLKEFKQYVDEENEQALIDLIKG